MKKVGLLASLLFLVYQIAWAGETIIGQEVENYFYKDEEMKQGKGQFENTYYLEGDTVTRVRVYDLIEKEVIPDDTVYHIQRQLLSDVGREPAIQAVGQPGAAAIEILVIGEIFIQSVKTTPDYFIVSRFKRIK